MKVFNEINVTSKVEVKTIEPKLERLWLKNLRFVWKGSAVIRWCYKKLIISRQKSSSILVRVSGHDLPEGAVQRLISPILTTTKTNENVKK